MTLNPANLYLICALLKPISCTYYWISIHLNSLKLQIYCFVIKQIRVVKIFKFRLNILKVLDFKWSGYYHQQKVWMRKLAHHWGHGPILNRLKIFWSICLSVVLKISSIFINQSSYSLMPIVFRFKKEFLDLLAHKPCKSILPCEKFCDVYHTFLFYGGSLVYWNLSLLWIILLAKK